MADMTTLIVISSFIMFPAVMMAQEVVNHGVCPLLMFKEEEEILKEQKRNREQMEEIMREIEISCLDECKTGLHNCHDDAHCTNTKRSFTCTCKPGYFGDGVNCADINECKTGEHLCERDISDCKNAEGYYQCVCRSGYEHKCKDKCKRGQHNCHHDAYCTSTERSFTCTCKPGYFGNGVNCAVFAEGLNDSIILGDNVHHLAKLTKWLKPVAQSESSKWKRCWRASVDGWAASTFHSGCDNKGPTVTIIRVGGTYIFGGYTKLSWGYSSCPGYRKDSQAFLFSLVNKPRWAPVKLPAYQNYRYAVDDCSSRGPVFGAGWDLAILNNASSSNSSHSNLGHTYRPPRGYSRGSTFSRTFLAGTFRFTPDEVETFYETT